MKAFCNFSPGIFARATTKFAEAAKDDDDQLCSYNGRIIGSSIKRVSEKWNWPTRLFINLSIIIIRVDDYYNYYIHCKKMV